MANRFPLIVDTDDGNKLKEIPEGDLLNLANSGIANLGSLSVSGDLSGSTLTTTSNATIGGTLNVTGATTVAAIEASGITIGGETVRVPLNPDWNETDNTSIAFIQNKPDLDNLAPATLGAIGDVFVDAATSGQVLTWDGFSWQAQDAPGQSDAAIQTLARAALDLVTNPASGRGSFVYDNNTGQFTFTPANTLIKGQQDNISELVNDSQYVNASYLDTNEYLASGDVLGFGRITATVVSGQVQLTFNDTGFLTQESDTLATVTARGATTTDTIEADAFTQTLGSTTANSMNDLEVINLTVTNGISATFAAGITLANGNITTNGDIQATQATFTGNVNTGTTITGPTIIQNTTGDMELIVPTGNRVDITAGRLRLGGSALPISSPEVGEIFTDSSAFYGYVNDIGTGSAGPVAFPGYFASLGLQLPAFESADLPSAAEGSVEGMMAYNLTDGRPTFFNGSTWTNL